MFTFQVTRLHERHLPEYRFQGVSHLPHTVRGGTREREGKHREREIWIVDTSYIRLCRRDLLFASAAASAGIFGHFSAVKMHRAICNVIYRAVVSRGNSACGPSSFLLFSLHSTLVAFYELLRF